jgi:filamentous hemagglutinin family protein
VRLFISVITFFWINATLQAEITSDGTLGTRTALQGPNYTINAELGQQSGGHLFHSFEQFNLNTGESATFSGPNTVNNIISRVTGGSPSAIDGTLRSTIPNANLYFLNPFGIMFGANATLDISGSFHATTADVLQFNDGSQFNARNPSASNLTVAPISAFGFLTETPQSLSLTDSHLKLPTGKTLSLIGGQIDIHGSLIEVPSGRVNLASLAQAGEVAIALPNDLPVFVPKQDLTVQDSAIDISGGGKESGIYIRAGQFLLQNTAVTANTESAEPAGKIDVQADTLIATNRGQFISETKGAGQGGTIKIRVSGLTEFSGEMIDEEGDIEKSEVSVVSRENGGEGGSVEIETASLALKNGGQISATTRGQGQGGNISIQATDTVTLSGADSEGNVSFIAANAYGEMENAGHGGIIDVKAREVQLIDGATIQTRTKGPGHGGQIHIYAVDEITLAGEGELNTSRISSDAQSNGDGGWVNLETNQLNLLDGTFITADTQGSGAGGNINIHSNVLNLKGLDSYGYGSLITATTDATGKGGNIEINANHLALVDGAQITVSTFSSSQGGDLNIKANEILLSGHDQSEDVYHSGVLTTSEGETAEAGKAGNMNLEVGALYLEDTAEVNAGTYGPGQGGNIYIQARDINLTTGSNITAKSDGQGDAGKVVLNVNQLYMTGQSAIKTSAQDAGGGNIEFSGQNRIYIKDSQITTSVQSGTDDGGNITIIEPTFIVLNKGYIKAQADAGRGGNITLDSDYYIKTPGSIVSASSNVGIDGEINITALDENVSNSLVTISTDLNADAELEALCNKHQLLEEQMSHFIVTLPSSGKPISPGDWQASHLLSD